VLTSNASRCSRASKVIDLRCTLTGVKLTIPVCDHRNPPSRSIRQTGARSQGQFCAFGGAMKETKSLPVS
jgi:hypothetical protein